MILRREDIRGKSSPMTLCPLGDIQWAGERDDVAYDHLQDHIARCLELPNPRFIGLGDYIDFASPSNRELLMTTKLYDTTSRVIQDTSRALIDELYDKILKPTRRLWIGLVQGHHHFQVRASRRELVDSDEYLARRLGAPYLSEFGAVNLSWPDSPSPIGVVAYHGDGSSVFPWGPLNRLYRLAPALSIDILLMGHQTKKTVGEYDRLEFVTPRNRRPRIEHRTVHLVGTGGWSKGYINGAETYVSRKTLVPVALGQPIVHIRPRWRPSTHAGHPVWDRGITVEL